MFETVQGQSFGFRIEGESQRPLRRKIRFDKGQRVIWIEPRSTDVRSLVVSEMNAAIDIQMQIGPKMVQVRDVVSGSRSRGKIHGQRGYARDRDDVLSIRLFEQEFGLFLPVLNPEIFIARDIEASQKRPSPCWKQSGDI